VLHVGHVDVLQTCTTAEKQCIATSTTIITYWMFFLVLKNCATRLQFTALQEQRPVIIVASGAAGMGTARAAICWDALAASATERPVVVVYIVEAKESAAFMLEWDAWQAMGVHLFPVYIYDTDMDADTNGSNGVNGAKLLPQQDRCTMLLYIPHHLVVTCEFIHACVCAFLYLVCVVH
jgi:hypothetical protein